MRMNRPGETDQLLPGNISAGPSWATGSTSTRSESAATMARARSAPPDSKCRVTPSAIRRSDGSPDSFATDQASTDTS